MNIKTYIVNCATIGSSWIVKADSVNNAITETLVYLHDILKAMERKTGKDVDLELKVAEVKKTVTSIGYTGCLDDD